MLLNHRAPWSDTDLERLGRLCESRVDVVTISNMIGRSVHSIYRAIGRYGLSKCRYTANADTDPRLRAERVSLTRYQVNAIAGLRHCKDLRAAGYEPGFGELIVTSDGVPKNYHSQSNTSSIYGSTSALCVETAG